MSGGPCHCPGNGSRFRRLCSLVPAAAEFGLEGLPNCALGQGVHEAAQAWHLVANDEPPTMFDESIISAASGEIGPPQTGTATPRPVGSKATVSMAAETRRPTYADHQEVLVQYAQHVRPLGSPALSFGSVKQVTGNPVANHLYTHLTSESIACYLMCGWGLLANWSRVQIQLKYEVSGE